MEDRIYAFAPDAGEETTWMLWGIVILVVSGGLSAWVLYGRSAIAQRRKGLLAMLLFFAALLGGGTALFSALALQKLKPITMDATSISIGQTAIPWEEIADLRVVQYQQRNALNQTTGTTRLLALQQKKGKAYYFSDASYPLAEMMGAIRELAPALLE